jgi:hypothetical protein
MRSSVVDVVTNRQITGRMPPMEVHLHSDVNLLMLWNKKQDDHCFKNCILRYTVDTDTHYQLKKFLIECYGKAKYCMFGYMCLTNAEGLDASRRPLRIDHSIRPRWVRDEFGITCTCPVIPFLEEYDHGEPISLHADSKMSVIAPL